MIDVSPWFEYGPRLIFCIVLVLVTVLLIVVSRGAAGAYGRTAEKHAREFRRFSKKYRKAKRTGYEAELSSLVEKLVGARKVQRRSVLVLAVVPVFLGAGTGLTFVLPEMWAWVAGAVVAVVVGVLVFRGMRNRHAALRERLDAQLDLDEAPSREDADA